MGDFDSAWLKWGRGVVHTQALDREITAEMKNFEARHPYTASTEYHPKRHCVALRIHTIDSLPVHLGLLLGDVANNYRSSLDQLAWALVTTRGVRALSSKHEGSIYFPLAASEKDFESHLVSSVYLSDRDKRIVRRYQPFWNTDRSRRHSESKLHRHCLTVLSKINRDDKHKAIRPVWAWPIGGKLLVGDVTDCTVTRVPQRARGIVLQPGAEIQRIYVKKTGPNPDVYMEAHLAVEPSLDGRITLNSWLTETTLHIRNLLLRFAKPPEEINSLWIIPSNQGETPPDTA